MAEKDYALSIIKKFDDLKGAASTRDQWINDIAKYSVPQLYNAQYSNSNSIDNIPSDVYSTAMVHATNTFSSGLQGYLTNPASRWFGLKTQDINVMNETSVKRFFENAEKVMYATLASSNFYQQIHESYRSLSFGNCVLYREFDEKDVIRYYTLPLYECYFEHDKAQRINSMYREMRRSATQLIEEFGDKCSKTVKGAYERGDVTTRFIVIHAVRPRWQRDSSKVDAKNKAYESMYVEKDNKNVLRESGFDIFPFFVGQFTKDPLSQYALGPGHFSLYSVRSLNQSALTTIRSFQKKTDPPLSVPYEGFVMPIMTDPNTFNYRTSDDPRDKIEPIVTGSDPFTGMEFMKWMIEEINQAYFVDLFNAITSVTKRMTNDELAERVAEKSPLLGPAIGRLMTEFIDPIIYDLFTTLLKKDSFGPVPEALQGVDYVVEYLSPLAKAQKVAEINGLGSFVNMAAPAIQLNPEAADNINTDEYIRIAHDASGIPQTILNSKKVVKKKRDARAQQNAEMLAAQQAQSATQNAKTASEADLNSSKARSQ